MSTYMRNVSLLSVTSVILSIILEMHCVFTILGNMVLGSLVTVVAGALTLQARDITMNGRITHNFSYLPTFLVPWSDLTVLIIYYLEWFWNFCCEQHVIVYLRTLIDCFINIFQHWLHFVVALKCLAISS